MVKLEGQCHGFILYHKTFSVLVSSLCSVNVNFLSHSSHDVTHTPHTGTQKCLFTLSML